MKGVFALLSGRGQKNLSMITAKRWFASPPAQSILSAAKRVKRIV